VQLNLLSAYAGGISVGQRQLFVYSAVGPASYSQTTQDPVALPTGVYLDAMNECLDTTGTYEVIFYPSATNTTRATWTAVWFVVATAAQVANGVNLSGVKIQFSANGGEF
jgi:hypothetical protein